MNKFGLCLIILSFLFGCGATREAPEPTLASEKVQQVTVTAISTVEPTAAVEPIATVEPTAALEPTSTVEPVPTEGPTTTPEPWADFQRCMESVDGVRYVITGEGIEEALLQWEDDAASSHRRNLELPVCMMFTGFAEGDILMVSGKVSSPDENAKSISCRILDGETELAREEITEIPLWTYCTARAK